MCEFFSFLSNGKNRYFYLNAEQRGGVKDTDLKPDSHSSITKYFQDEGLLALGAETEDKLNKYEFNPFSREFKVDQINTKDDSEQAEKWVRKLDFKEIVPQLRLKPILHPFGDKRRRKVNKKDIARLKEWIKVWHSVSNSVSASVLYPVGYFVRASVLASVLASIGASVRDSVRTSIRASIGDSVRTSIWDSVWYSVSDSAYAYISSFFELENWQGIDHEVGVNPFQPCIDLWESGLVPSFDGETWRLHGHKGKVLFEMKK